MTDLAQEIKVARRAHFDALDRLCEGAGTRDEIAECQRALDDLIERKHRIETAPPRPPARFGYSRENGGETLWIEGVSGRRVIHGIASTPTINSHGYSLASKGCTIKLPVRLLSQHGEGGEGIGEVFYVCKSATQIYVRARLFETAAADHAWQLIESGETRAFSGAGVDLRLQAIVDKKKFYDRWTLAEVSVCRRGANSDCGLAVFEPWRT